MARKILKYPMAAVTVCSMTMIIIGVQHVLGLYKCRNREKIFSEKQLKDI